MSTTKSCRNVLFGQITSDIVDKMKDEFTALQKKVIELEEALKGIQIHINGLNIPSNADQLISDLKAELLKSLASKHDFEVLLKRVESLETTSAMLKDSYEKAKAKINSVDNQTCENTAEIDKLKEKMKMIEEKLTDKISYEEYDKLLAMIGQMQPGSAPSAPIAPLISTKELNMIREMVKRIPDIELRLESLFK